MERGSCRAAETVEAVSPVAGRAGGPARSSREAPAGRGGGGAKGPGHLWCVRSINRERVFREELGGQAEAVREHRRASGRVHRCLTLRGMGPLLDHLREIGVVPEPEPWAAIGRREQLIEAFTGYLMAERGLADLDRR